MENKSSVDSEKEIKRIKQESLAESDKDSPVPRDNVSGHSDDNTAITVKSLILAQDER